jgi:sugar O-acyltransferase (sialic acid O-acetyltransferase NeuD family)
MDLVILGAGGHAAELLSYLADLEKAGRPMRLLGLIDEAKPPGDWEGHRILGAFDALRRLLDSHGDAPLAYLTAVGDNRARQRLVAKAVALAGRRPLVPWGLSHPKAAIGRSVTIGEGTVLAPGSIVTTRTQIGQHCIANVKVSVSHDCTVANFVNLNPGVTICGNARIGEGAYIGAGATVINGVSIGAWSIVGAGAVVVRDIPAHVTAVGVPARVIKQHLGS